MFKVELEAGDLGEYQSCGVQGLGEPLESGDCFHAGSYLSDTWDGGLYHCHLQTGVCLLVTARGVILLGWELWPGTPSTGVAGDAPS